MIELKRIIEAIFFSASKPISATALCKRLADQDPEEIQLSLAALQEEYRLSDGAIEIVEVSGGYQMRTRTAYKEWIRLFVKEKDVSLTKPLLETLSIIAYQQPISKKEVDGARGIDSARAIKHLLERKLIDIAGRNDDPGKPMVFRTTRTFLELYGLKDIRDLPTLREIEFLER
jgi:segregation and condensation protein B